MANFTEIPQWENQGVAPTAELRTRGFAVGYKPPAQTFNYLFNKFSVCINELQNRIGKDNIVTGINAFACNNGNTASGDNSHAEGNATTASGAKSHAEGGNTTANGTASHAEGYGTIADGIFSHAEGGGTIASDINSHAEGSSTEASGDSSHAEGKLTKAIGYYSHAEGIRTTAFGSSSSARGFSSYNVTDIISGLEVTTPNETIITAWGNKKFSLAKSEGSVTEGSNCLALNRATHAEGYNTIASGLNSHSECSSTTASGANSHAEGNSTEASGNSSHAEGGNTTANGTASHAEGYGTIADGNYSHAGGFNNIANAYQTVLGRYAVEQSGLVNDSKNIGSVFILGNGLSDATRSNAFRVTSSGEVLAAGNYYTTGADYAELFEWADGNESNEDRRGLFVTLDGEKIRLANANDDYILGVVSANPSVVGDSYSENWKDMYLRDVFGAYIVEEVDVPETTDEETGETIPAHKVESYVLNPEYDPEKEYISRTDRKEWGTVGMFGKLVVIDDGTCEVNGYCTVSNDGKATNAEAGYRVLSRIDETHIKILYR